MARYALSRILWLIPTLLALSLITFAVMHATPGSPLQPIAPNANPLSPEAQQNLARAWGLDQPLWQQYGRFLWRALQLDFGPSYVYATRDVTDILAEAFPVSLHLGLMALALALLLGVPLGILAAVNRNGPIDYLCRLVAVLAVSFPSFVLGIALIVLFVLVLPVIPHTGGWSGPADWILPTLALGLGPLGVLARYTRAGLIDALGQDYIRTAKAKGLPARRVVGGHALRNALLPPLTILGPMVARLGTGSFFVETIFRVPGMGRYFVDSMIARDYPMIMSVILLFGAFLALMNLLVDLLYGLFDPRLRAA